MLLGGLAVASFTDIRWTRIPNALTFPMMAVGLFAAIVERDPNAVYGWLLATAVYFPLFALGISRAGDAKLMMAIGALVGPSETAETLAWTAIVYLPVQLVVLAVRGKLANLVATARYQADQLLGRPTGPSPEMTMGVTGPIIAVAGVLAWSTSWMARWVS